MVIGLTHDYYRPAVVERAIAWVRQIAEDRRFMRRLRPLFVPELPEPLPPSVGAREPHRPVDVAHWLPNMPRGSEHL
jgi:hypothetical protein